MRDVGKITRRLLFALEEKRYAFTAKLGKCIFSRDPGKTQYRGHRSFSHYTEVKAKLFSGRRDELGVSPGEDDLPENTVMLDLAGCCVDGQSVHPDVIEWPQGGAWLVMAISSYPFRCERMENPEFLKSRDGIHWVCPAGCPSPMFRAEGKLAYCSDPSLLLAEDGTLCFYNRMVSIQKDGSAVIYLELRQSVDGVTWTQAERIYEKKCVRDNHEKLLSPSFLYTSSGYLCWYAERGDDGIHRVCRVQGDSPHKWNARETVTFTGLPKTECVWHLDVCRMEDGMLMMAADTRGEDGHRIRAFVSEDEGFSWCGGRVLAAPKPGFAARGVYRASVVPANGRALLYYSGRSRSDCWRTAVSFIEKEKTV